MSKSCKDCLHYELCKYNTYQEAHYFGKDKEIYIKIDNNSPCKFFIDRSEWVHLPDEEYTFTVRGDIALGVIIANCRAAEAEKALNKLQGEHK